MIKMMLMLYTTASIEVKVILVHRNILHVNRYTHTQIEIYTIYIYRRWGVAQRMACMSKLLNVWWESHQDLNGLLDWSNTARQRQERHGGQERPILNCRHEIKHLDGRLSHLPVCAHPNRMESPQRPLPLHPNFFTSTSIRVIDAWQQ